ncbi:unnamed protein product [Ilex paraguariensis]|uniref:Uncharacterized protein n=1 Tax=Ilex paraguariensis TaxID=185542 RepID=A0ABC8TUP7_9AQUA
MGQTNSHRFPESKIVLTELKLIMEMEMAAMGKFHLAQHWHTYVEQEDDHAQTLVKNSYARGQTTPPNSHLTPTP